MPTIYNNPKTKPFAWSFSKLKNFEVCPKKYYHVDVLKDVVEEESEILSYGNTVHTILAQYIGRGTILPPVHEKTLKPIADKYIGEREGSEILVEQKYALTKDFEPTDYFAKDVWFRGIADFVKIRGQDERKVALAADWKLGKIKEDYVQLALMACCIFAHRPDVQAIRTEFVWIKEDAVTREDFKRDDVVKIWNNVLPRVSALEHAHKTTTFPAKPGGLCRRWCPVKKCPHFGEGG